MPIYEYQCSSCGHQLEAMQKMADPVLTDCPECHKPSLNKLVSAAGFQLKGTGWYVTDYSSKGKPKSSQESVPATTNKSTESKSTESKTTDKGSSSNSGAGSS